MEREWKWRRGVGQGGISGNEWECFKGSGRKGSGSSGRDKGIEGMKRGRKDNKGGGTTGRGGKDGGVEGRRRGRDVGRGGGMMHFNLLSCFSFPSHRFRFFPRFLTLQPILILFSLALN